MLSPTREPQFPFYTLLISGGHTLFLNSNSLTQHTILVNTRDTAIGDYLDKIARSLRIPWNGVMPGAALEHYSQINLVSAATLAADVERWGLPRPFSHFQKNVPAYSFTGVRTAVEKVVQGGGVSGEEEGRSLGRAAQVVGFEHVVQKCVLGIKKSGDSKEGNLVVSGGVACNLAFRRMYARRWTCADVDCGMR